MRTNLEKWNYYLSIIEEKTNKFIASQKEGKKIPSIYYVVYPVGKVAERTIIDIKYSHYKHGGRTYFNGKKPTKKEVGALAAYSATDIPFTVDNLWFKYSEIWGKENNCKSSSSVRFTDVITEKGLYYSIEDAEKQGEIIRKHVEEEKAFKELHKKDGGYDYAANGYKFLDWQNGWKHDYYDEDGSLCEETGKSHKSFGYSKENYPEYRKCIDSKHRRIEVSHNQRGSENTVSCPICKIYWKYDSSD
jgi:hypothetical protein